MQSVQRMPELAMQFVSRFKKKKTEPAPSKKVVPVASADEKSLKQAWEAQEKLADDKMTNAKAKANLEMHPVLPQQDVSGDKPNVPCSNNGSDQGGTLKHALCSITASAQGGTIKESSQDSARKEREAADRANEDFQVIPPNPQADFPGASSSGDGQYSSSQKAQELLHPDNGSDGDNEIGSNLALADVPGKPAEVKADSFADEDMGKGISKVDLEVEPESLHSKIDSNEVAQFFSSPAPKDLQQCAVEVQAWMASRKVNPAREDSEEEEEQEKEKEQQEEQEEEEDEEEANARKMEDMERRLEDWHVYWKMPPMQKVQIRCLLGLRPFP